MRLSIRCYKNAGDHPIYGECITTTRGIEMAPNHFLDLYDKEGKKNGYIIFNRFEMNMRSGLL